jgi:hypothetical protein
MRNSASMFKCRCQRCDAVSGCGKNRDNERGETVADVCDNKTAQDIAERLNENEHQREEDRWSA